MLATAHAVAPPKHVLCKTHGLQPHVVFAHVTSPILSSASHLPPPPPTLILDGDVLVFACADGYEIASGSGNNACQDGAWATNTTCVMATQPGVVPADAQVEDGTKITAMATSTIASITVLPIGCLLLFTVLLCAPWFTPTPGVRTELQPGHHTCWAWFSSPHIHWLSRTPLFYITPLILFDMACIIVILSSNALASVDGEAIHMIGQPACTGKRCV